MTVPLSRASHEIVFDPARIIEQQRITHLSFTQTATSAGVKPLQGGAGSEPRGYACPICDTSNNPAGSARVQMLVQNAGAVVNGHFITRERHHFGAQRLMQVVQRRFFAGRDQFRASSRFAGRPSGVVPFVNVQRLGRGKCTWPGLKFREFRKLHTLGNFDPQQVREAVPFRAACSSHRPRRALRKSASDFGKNMMLCIKTAEILCQAKT